ncbi:NAD(P)H-dependent oxidoreductase [Jannaschia donghaensis]|uniref:General stress protein 14 n=1 Tax=Jannaschia donghaensis TaxID=420998 RepID=A0A0M6YFR0_9RHOB|nr:NAD(P)H-dependent oxidoreductase [Jannaschia donghaensis]CTQ48107.1 General stress protein 14 [Jannaschia donghaensis]
MRALIVFCHPKTDSFSAAVLSEVTARLEAAKAEYRVRDLYRSNFTPVLTAQDLDVYLDEAANTEAVAQDVADLQWADTLIFVYPTWWYGLPAMLKGWLDRVLVPGVAFIMPEGSENIRPGLAQITRIGVFTTCGASWWLTQVIGAPGKRTLTRGVRSICARRCRTYYAAHHLMDSSTPDSRAAHLSRVGRIMERLVA